MNFDLHRLRLLTELSHRGTIVAVAAELNFSAATVSQQLALLQREVGTTLLERTGRRVRLTPEAHVLVAHAEAVFDRLEAAEADLVRAHGELVGTIRVAAFQTVVLALFPTVLEDLARHHPRLRVELSQAESEIARAGLLPHDFDIVVDEVYPGRSSAPDDTLTRQVLADDPLRIAAATLCAPEADLSAYADRAWVMEPKGSPAREWAVDVCRRAGFEPDVQFESTDVVVHEHLVRTGRVVAFLPDLLPPTEASAVRRRQLEPEHSRRLVATTRRSSLEHPAIATLLDALTQAAQRLRREVGTPA